MNINVHKKRFDFKPEHISVFIVNLLSTYILLIIRLEKIESQQNKNYH